MAWKELEPAPHASYQEAALQALFDNWGDTAKFRDGWSLAGLPEWLDGLGKPDERKRFNSYGYDFQPDVFWRAAGYVVELKCAAKYEPMALAEVLHHAEMLTRGSDRISPVIVSKFNGWIRAALASLRSRYGLPWNAVRYYEADLLVGDRRRFIWLDAPLAPWVRLPSRPKVIPSDFDAGADVWYEIGETRAYAALQAPCDDRPPFPVGKMAMVAPVARTDGSLLCWRGEYPALGESYSRRAFEGKYRLWEPLG